MTIKNKILCLLLGMAISISLMAAGASIAKAEPSIPPAESPAVNREPDIPPVPDPNITEPPTTETVILPKDASRAYKAVADVSGKSRTARISKNGDTGKEDKQFVTFTTKSGKVFHLIIDYAKNVDNVYLLTEVSEQDLMNFAEQDIENESGETWTGNEPSANPEQFPAEQGNPSAPSSGNHIGYILIAVIGIGGLSFFLYKKYIKRKNDNYFIEESEDYPEPEEPTSPAEPQNTPEESGEEQAETEE